MRIAIFGGTFDPIHLGHLLIAEAAREQFRLERILFLPTAVPPHKSSPTALPAHRLAMVRSAVRGHRAFQVSDWEIRQNKTVYTVEALAHFQSRFPKAELFFIVGSDSLRDLPSWKTGTALLKKCRFLVADRPGAEWAHLPASLRRQASRIDAPVLGVASHTLRARVAKGQSIRYQVPDRVERYVADHRLYRSVSR